MKKVTAFDVLIVYSQQLASSATCSRSLGPFPLRSKNVSYNIVYSYFLETCATAGLKAAFTTSADIIGPGLCQCYWIYKNKKWHKVNNRCFSKLIFDKFSPTSKFVKSQRDLLFSDKSVKPFNNPDLFNLFFDKQLTYRRLTSHSIPTVSLRNGTSRCVEQTLKKLSKMMCHHPGSHDFSSDLVMKDRYGAGGRHVYKFKSGQSEDMLAVIRKNSNISFIVQPFAIFDKGFSYQNLPASADIRLIYLGGSIFQSYIRVAKSGEFRCNEHQGGLLTYLPLKDIPKSVITKSNDIAGILNQKNSLYALDFIISNNGTSYLLEGNTGPGLDWNMSLKKNETEAKKLIRHIVTELSARANFC